MPVAYAGPEPTTVETYSKKSVAGRYERMVQDDRSAYEFRSQESSRYTIPYLFPQPGSDGNTEFADGYSSVGMRGVNNLTSKVVSTNFPTNVSFVAYELEPLLAKRLAMGDRKFQRIVNEKLAIWSDLTEREIEISGMRPVIFEAVRLSLATMDSLLYIPDAGKCRCYRGDMFVIDRDCFGNLLSIIIKETIAEEMLTEAAYDALVAADKLLDKDNEDRSEVEYDIYTCIDRKHRSKRFEVYQEIRELRITSEDHEGSYEEDDLPWIVVGYFRVSGENYSRSKGEECIGDLKSVEALRTIAVEGLATLGKVVFCVKPGSGYTAEDLETAKPGRILSGDPAGAGAIQANKTFEIQAVFQGANELATDLGKDWLLFLPRASERTTAEEIRIVAQELDAGNGGLYSHYVATLQRPVVARVLARLREQGYSLVEELTQDLPDEIKAFFTEADAKEAIKPRIVTGLEALGRAQELNRLNAVIELLAKIGTSQAAMGVIELRALAGKAFLAAGLDPEEYLQSDAKIADAQRDAMKLEQLKAVGPHLIAAQQATAAAEQPAGAAA